MTSGAELYSLQPFVAKPWMSQISKDQLPSHRVVLAQLPTPCHLLQPFTSPNVPPSLGGVELHIKRDDLTSFDLSGNKVRKLEFLLANALQTGCDTVITIGGLQSNHCRATAVAARQLGLTPVLILRTTLTAEDIALEGNLLLSRMAGARIFTVSPEEYYAKGGDFFVAQLAARLEKDEGRRCCEIPCGGSNTLGTFGYLNAVTELMAQSTSETSDPAATLTPCRYDHVVFGCGSGGTAAGLAIGVHLARLDVQLHAIGVCDTPDDFYEVIRQKAESLGVQGDVRDWISITDGQGLGYGESSDEELRLLRDVSSQTGITLDPVYSGKALFTFCTKMLAARPDTFRPGDKVLFVHTGGALGCYSKASQLLPLIKAAGEIQTL